MILDPLQYLRAIADASKDSYGSSSSSVTWGHILLASLQVAIEKSIRNDKDLLLRKLYDELLEAVQGIQLESRPPSLSDDDLVKAVRELTTYEADRPPLSQPQDRFLRWLSDCPANLDDWTKSTWRHLLNEHHVEATYFELQDKSSASLSNKADRKIGDELNPPSNRRTKSSVRLQHWLPTLIVVVGFFAASIAFTWQNGRQVKESLVEIPVGGITIFYGSEKQLPENWKLCNGQLVSDPESRYNGKTLPDLQGRFVRGVTSDDDVMDIGGSDSLAGHNHVVNLANWPTKPLLCMDNNRNSGTTECNSDTTHVRVYGGKHYVFPRSDVSALVHDPSFVIKSLQESHPAVNLPRYMAMHYIIRIK